MHKNSEELSRIVFVGGSPRSGTTLVQRVLNHHPKIYGGPEFDFIPDIAELYQRMRDSIRSGRIASIVDEATVRQVFRELITSLLIPKAEAGRYMGVSNIATASAGFIARPILGPIIDAVNNNRTSTAGYRVMFGIVTAFYLIALVTLRPVREIKVE